MLEVKLCFHVPSNAVPSFYFERLRYFVHPLSTTGSLRPFTNNLPRPSKPQEEGEKNGVITSTADGVVEIASL
jgi:hypothetical protein